MRMYATPEKDDTWCMLNWANKGIAHDKFFAEVRI